MLHRCEQSQGVRLLLNQDVGNFLFEYPVCKRNLFLSPPEGAQSVLNYGGRFEEQPKIGPRRIVSLDGASLLMLHLRSCGKSCIMCSQWISGECQPSIFYNER
jgi:hypothetical protein